MSFFAEQITTTSFFRNFFLNLSCAATTIAKRHQFLAPRKIVIDTKREKSYAYSVQGMAFRWSRNLFMKFLLIWARLYCERRCRRLNAKNISKIIRRWHLKLNLYEMHDNRNEIKRNEFNDVKNASGHNWSRSRNFRNDFDLLINFFFLLFSCKYLFLFLVNHYLFCVVRIRNKRNFIACDFERFRLIVWCVDI